jgi:NAD(P)-dependent dehydrogenase (short-subunit alcohol dehydrogenase family)
MPPMDLQRLFGVAGKTVLVTGGGTGIGRMISQGFVDNGAKVYIASRKEASRAAADIVASSGLASGEESNTRQGCA